jgi:hypothetical protein
VNAKRPLNDYASEKNKIEQKPQKSISLIARKACSSKGHNASLKVSDETAG